MSVHAKDQPPATAGGSDAQLMSSVIQSNPTAFTGSARERLEVYLAGRLGPRGKAIVALTPDASTREYFRIPWDKGNAVAAVYPEPFDASVHPYLDVSRLFRDCNLPVPEVYDIAAELSACARVLCHRDYHTANLMLDPQSRVRVVDHQDARMGPASYDLVSLLLDRQPAPPSLAEIRGHRLFFLDTRRRYGLEAI